MSEIYIIAGPPGIGKSTRGHQFIPEDLDIVNEDEVRFKYKDAGFVDYNEYSIHRVRDIIKRKLIRNEDFALELNLGYPHQYDYALAMKAFNRENKLNVVLFFTDDLQFCQDRAKIRYESGLHLVKPEVISQMYHNTLPLFKTHFKAIDSAVFLDLGDHNSLTEVAAYFRENNKLELFQNDCIWFGKDLKPFIEQHLGLAAFPGPKLSPGDLKDGDPDYRVSQKR